MTILYSEVFVMKTMSRYAALFLVFVFSQILVAAQSPEAPAQPVAQQKQDAPGVAIAEYYRECVLRVEKTMTVDFGAMSMVEQEQLRALGEFFIVDTNEATMLFLDNDTALGFVHDLTRQHRYCSVSPAKYAGGDKMSASGSGFFCDAEGGFYTAGHVAKAKHDELSSPFGIIKITSYEYWVTLPSKGRKYKAESVGVDASRDVAYMRVKGIASADYKIAKMGDSGKMRPGDPVYTFGSPRGLTNTLTRGVISNTNCIIGLHYIESFLQTDAPINQGSSGSPLINEASEVVGINDAGVPGADGLGFAVPVEFINLEQLKKGDVLLPWFGAEALLENFERLGTAENAGVLDVIRMYDETGILDSCSIQELLRLTYDAGFLKPEASFAIVNDVDQSKINGRTCPANRPGMALERGDLILKVNGAPIRSGMDLRIAIVSISPGQAFDIEYIRVCEGKAAPGVARGIVLEKKPEQVKK